MQDRICPSIYGVELEIAIFIMIMNHTCVYGYGRVNQILDESRNARTGDGSNTALRESQRVQSYTWPCTRVAKIWDPFNVNVEVWLSSLEWTDHPLVHVAQLGTLFLLLKVLPRPPQYSLLFSTNLHCSFGPTQ